MLFSVLLCAHNPRPDHLRATLQALRAQTCPQKNWELILVDSGSQPPLSRRLLDWHPHGQVCRETLPGLTRARRRAIALARGEILVFCDDDNLLATDYLAQAERLLRENPELGAIGGKALPVYASPPPAWLAPFTDRLAVRDLGGQPRLASWKGIPVKDRTYPDCSPLGAGLILRHDIALAYALALPANPAIGDRCGRRLSSGGDNDLVLATLHQGWSVGYFPELVLSHLIPRERLSLRHLARLNRASSESWVQVLARNGIVPWPRVSRTGAWLRQARAFLRHRAWKNRASFVRWAGACGIFAGRARLSRS